MSQVRSLGKSARRASILALSHTQCLLKFHHCQKEVWVISHFTQILRNGVVRNSKSKPWTQPGTNYLRLFPTTLCSYTTSIVQTQTQLVSGLECPACGQVIKLPLPSLLS
jgi:hypothetical protein